MFSSIPYKFHDFGALFGCFARAIIAEKVFLYASGLLYIYLVTFSDMELPQIDEVEELAQALEESTLSSTDLR